MCTVHLYVFSNLLVCVISGLCPFVLVQCGQKSQIRSTLLQAKLKPVPMFPISEENISPCGSSWHDSVTGEFNRSKKICEVRHYDNSSASDFTSQICYNIVSSNPR